MEKILFVTWLLLFPLIDSVSSYLSYLTHPTKVYSNDALGIAALATLAIYFFVAWLLYP